MTTLRRITYHGKDLHNEPENTSLEELRKVLYIRQPTMAVLEPGNATRYMILLVPCDSITHPSLSSFGIPPHTRYTYCFVSLLTDYQCLGTWVPTDREVDVHDVEDLSNNPWTREIIAWWLNELFLNGMWRREIER